MRWKSIPSKADVVLGKNLKELRVSQDMTQMQLGKKVNNTSQQIDKYESGAKVPAPKLEELAEALGSPIPKKLIRKIVNCRKLEMEDGLDQQAELIDLYNEIFAKDEEEEAE